MQSGYTGHIVPAEWRWVVVVGSALVLLAFAPFIWVAIFGTGQAQWQFMGTLHGFPDAPTYLAKMLQGARGVWLVQFEHTPEPHNGVFLQVIYPVLGQVGRLIGLPPIVVFHVARVGAALIMYMAIYEMAASIWMRVRTRRIFFMIVSVGAGFGWLIGTLTHDPSFPDLSAPEAYPFASTLVNVHFPLAVACLAVLASILIVAFRPGANEDPHAHNGGLIGMLVSLLLALLSPEASLLFDLVVVLYVVVYGINHRQVTGRAVRWMLVFLAPSVPILLLYGAFLLYNPAMAEWNRQNVATPPSLLALILGFGFPLLLALPGIWRALRRFEPDGDQFMALWLGAMVVAIYAPTNIHQHFVVGMMIPIGYFAARSIEDFWFNHLTGRWRMRLFVGLVPVMALSHVLILFLPILPLMTRTPDQSAGIFLERDYAAAFRWLDDRTTPSDVILASPNVSAWLPGHVNARVVYGHPAETLQADIKRQAVLDWYTTQDATSCDALLNGKYTFGRAYRVSYVLMGPEERQLGDAPCLSQLRWVVTVDRVDIYTP